jgi:hypothetical protein
VDGATWRLRIGALATETLAVLAEVLGSAAARGVQIEQPPMNAIFATLMRLQARERAAEAPAPAAVPAPAGAPS